MRKALLATVAAVGLTAGTIAVSAQGMQGGASGAGNAGGPPAAAPAEKIDKNGLKGDSDRSQSRDRSTTGQGAGSGAPDRGSSQSQPSAGQGAGERGQSGQMQQRPTQSPSSTQSPSGRSESGQSAPSQNRESGQSAQGQGGGATSANLSTEQRTKIRETVLRGGNVNRVSNVNFNISVGTVVPRSVHLVAVPSTIVEVHPAWRGFMYFVVNDEIIIVEPGSLKIVAVIT